MTIPDTFLYNHGDLVACLDYDFHGEPLPIVIGTIVDMEYSISARANLYHVEWSDGKDDWYGETSMEEYATCYRTMVDV